MRGGRVAALVFVAVGVAMVARTIQLGVGGGLGLVFGSLLVLVGGLRCLPLASVARGQKPLRRASSLRGGLRLGPFGALGTRLEKRRIRRTGKGAARR